MRRITGVYKQLRGFHVVKVADANEEVQKLNLLGRIRHQTDADRREMLPRRKYVRAHGSTKHVKGDD